MTQTFDLTELQEKLADVVKDELASTPEVHDVGDRLDVDKLPIEKRRWHKSSDVLAVVADLKNSTQLGTGKWAASTASIYEAATGNVVRIFDRFAADFLQIQGDGVVGLFWGDRRYERAVCAGVTIRTFSDELVDQLETKWDNLEGVTGYKVGIATSRLLVKKVGTPRNPAQQEPVWAGKSVNFAAKAAQCADRHEMIVTGSVWDKIARNDYLAFSCPCGNGPSSRIWEDCTIDRLPDSEPEAVGRRLTVGWCTIHGSEYCDAVMSGEDKRPDAGNARAALAAQHFKSAIWQKAENERRDRRARIAGLNG